MRPWPKSPNMTAKRKGKEMMVNGAAHETNESFTKQQNYLKRAAVQHIVHKSKSHIKPRKLPVSLFRKINPFTLHNLQMLGTEQM